MLQNYSVRTNFCLEFPYSFWRTFFSVYNLRKTRDNYTYLIS